MQKAEDKNDVYEMLSAIEEFKEDSTSVIGIGISSEILIAFIQAHAVTLNGVALPPRTPYRFKPYEAPTGGTVVSCDLEYGEDMISFKYSSDLSFASFMMSISKSREKLCLATLYSTSTGVCRVIVDGIPHTLHHRETLDLPATVNHIEVVFSKNI